MPLSYWILVGLRFVLTLLPQTGYIHPDEYFQNVEVIAGDIFEVDVARTWEFDPKFPIRNILIPKLILAPPFHLIRILNPFIKYYLHIDLRSPYFLLVIPRLVLCTLSLFNDFCLYRLCILYNRNYKSRLKIFASSYVVLVYCCRSFSNTFEMLFFSLLLLLVGYCMLVSDSIIRHQEYIQKKYMEASTPVEKVKIFKLQTHIPQYSFKHIGKVSAVVVLGIFNRPTFMGFALMPVFFWLHRGLGSKVVGFADFHARIFVFIIYCIPVVLLCILVDSAYYGYLTLADIESLKISWNNWVVTPLNFLRYNSDVKNLTGHGLHPRWLHVAVNVPLLFNVLGLLTMYSLSVFTYRFMKGQFHKLPRILTIQGLMLLSAVTPVAILSLFPHQEARFIIPVLLPLVFLYGNIVHINKGDMDIRNFKKLFTIIWYGCNIILTIFFGFVHQGGIYPLVNDLHNNIKSNYGTHFHVITTHSYSIPTYLLQLESTTKIWRDRSSKHSFTVAPSTFIHKFGSMPMDQLFNRVDDILTKAEMHYHKYKRKYKVYLVSPCSLDNNLLTEASMYSYMNVKVEKSYYPHYCTEALPQFPSPKHYFYCNSHKNNESQTDLAFPQRILCFLSKFCLKLYRITMIEYE